MKIRQGFVSNSSSTSFCIVGVGGCEEDEFTRKFVKDEELLKKIQADDGYGIYELDGDVSVYMECYDKIVYIGLDIGKIKDDETYNEFKDRALESLKKSGLNVTKEDIYMFQKCWRDG